MEVSRGNVRWLGYPPRKRRRGRSRLRAVVAASLGSAALLSLIAAILWVRGSPARPDPDPDTAEVRPPARQPPRVVYPYSVLPGGAYDADELDARLSADPIAARHYRPFDRTRAKMIQSPSEMLVYVSYRKDQQIYWTRKRIRIPQGEMLLTDGRQYARARCGNRISAIPQEPTERGSRAPAEQLLDFAEAPLAIDFSVDPPDPALTITVVPEPNSLLLLGTAAVVIGGLGWLRRRRVPHN